MSVKKTDLIVATQTVREVLMHFSVLAFDAGINSEIRKVPSLLDPRLIAVGGSYVVPGDPTEEVLTFSQEFIDEIFDDKAAHEAVATTYNFFAAMGLLDPVDLTTRYEEANGKF